MICGRSGLGACSLTYKVLLCSAKPIIHRQLHVFARVKPRTSDEHKIQAEHAHFRMLSTVADCGLARYTLQFTINVGHEFGPLDPHSPLPQFNAFARISLILQEFDPTPFRTILWASGPTDPILAVHISKAHQPCEAPRQSGA